MFFHFFSLLLSASLILLKVGADLGMGAPPMGRAGPPFPGMPMMPPPHMMMGRGEMCERFFVQRIIRQFNSFHGVFLWTSFAYANTCYALQAARPHRLQGPDSKYSSDKLKTSNRGKSRRSTLEMREMRFFLQIKWQRRSLFVYLEGRLGSAVLRWTTISMREWDWRRSTREVKPS